MSSGEIGVCELSIVKLASAYRKEALRFRSSLLVIALTPQMSLDGKWSLSRIMECTFVIRQFHDN